MMMRGKSFPRIPWSEFISERNQQYCDDNAIDLLDKMLKFDKNERITPRQAMQHPYFEPIVGIVKEQEAQGML